MIYAKLDDASALQRLDAAICEATKPKWYQRLLIIKEQYRGSHLRYRLSIPERCLGSHLRYRLSIPERCRGNQKRRKLQPPEQNQEADPQAAHSDNLQQERGDLQLQCLA